MYFFFLQFISLYMSLVAENWVMILIGLELKVLSLIPIMSKKKEKKFLVVYFVMKIFGTLFMIFGHLWTNAIFFLLGMMIKMSGFPLIWFPNFITSKMKFFLFFWMLTVQKFPVYIIWNEFLMKKKFWSLLMIFLKMMFISMQMFKSSSLLKFLGWKSIIHSKMNLLLLYFLGFKIFFILFLIYSLSLFMFFLKKKFFKKKSFKMYFSKNFLKMAFFLGYSGVPMFINIIAEIILFLKMEKFLGVVLMFSLILQLTSMMKIMLKLNFKFVDFENFNSFFFMMVFLAMIFLFMMFF